MPASHAATRPLVIRAMRASLTDRGLAHGARAVALVDRDLAGVLERLGTPPRWGRDPGFATLVQIILEQQVSLASGRAAFGRVVAVAGEVTPARIAGLSEPQLRAAGLTRQKAAYVRGLGLAIASGEFDIDAVARMDDDAAHAELIKLKGIGPWSADIYVLMALGRRDVWPSHDLALASAMREVKRLRSLPTPQRQLEIAEAWRPWRAVAARLLWHHYLNRASARRDRAPRPRRARPARRSHRA